MLGNPQVVLLSLDRKEDGGIFITPGIGGGWYDAMDRIIGNPELKKQNHEVQQRRAVTIQMGWPRAVFCRVGSAFESWSALSPLHTPRAL